MFEPRDMQPPESTLDIDWEHLYQISDANASFAVELLALLAQDTGAKVIVLWNTVRTGETSDFQELTHYIKGAAANMGVRTIVAIAQQLEIQDPRYDTATIYPLLGKLESAIRALADFVHHYLPQEGDRAP